MQRWADRGRLTLCAMGHRGWRLSRQLNESAHAIDGGVRFACGQQKLVVNVQPLNLYRVADQHFLGQLLGQHTYCGRQRALLFNLLNDLELDALDHLNDKNS